MAFENFVVEAGKPLPMGATLCQDGVNFSVFSRNAKHIKLVLFENADPHSKRMEISLSDAKHRTGDIWHCMVRGLKAGAFYLYRADGPYHPESGLRYNINLGLFDPYAKAITDNSLWNFQESVAYNRHDAAGDLSYNYNDNIEKMPRCIVIDDDFDWQGDRPLNYPLRFSILYETHIRGFTNSPSSGVQNPGTYRGVIEKIPYFKRLGITSIEFLPVHEFHENEIFRTNPRTGVKLRNYWGYSTVAFYAPKSSYAADRTPGAQVREFKEMVRELHKAGLEVILDVVFNHTAEGNEYGPSFCFRGLDNQIYYILNEKKRYYQNYTGCGNTVNCNNPVTRTFILDCLYYWVIEMHIDGFRFDLGSILGRNSKGELMENPPVLEQIAEDPVLRNTKIIAEAWDAGGAYQVGWFPGGRWAEWNDKYRDDVRKFWRGDPNQVQFLATRLSGSADLYLRDGRKPFHSINFITSHDGFTLKDLVSYNRKHNDENGEENRDGSENNNSANYGFEGGTENPLIEDLRLRQLKNFLTTLFISQGTPMLLGGDEFGRTQRGNNNAYCQDNEISWFDWMLLEKNAELFNFTSALIAFRKRHRVFSRPEFYTGKGGTYNALPDVSWFNVDGEQLDWEEADFAFSMRIDGESCDIENDRDDSDFFIMFNAGLNAVKFTIPENQHGKKWFRFLDTAIPPPYDITPRCGNPIEVSGTYKLKSRSVVILGS